MAAYEQRCADPDVVTREINGEMCLRCGTVNSDKPDVSLCCRVSGIGCLL